MRTSFTRKAAIGFVLARRTVASAVAPLPQGVRRWHTYPAREAAGAAVQDF